MDPSKLDPCRTIFNTIIKLIINTFNKIRAILYSSVFNVNKFYCYQSIKLESKAVATICWDSYRGKSCVMLANVNAYVSIMGCTKGKII